MASMSLCLPPRLCLHRLHWRPHGVVYQPTSMLNGSALVSKSGSTSSRFLDLRLREGYRILRCSASTNGDTATPESPVSPETTNGSVRSSSRKPQVWVAIGIAIVAVGLVVSGIVRTNNLFGSNQREASQLLTDMSISASSSQSVEQFTVNWFGRKFFLSERSPGYMYFLLLMAAGFGLFVSEEALNVWSRDAFLSSLSANLPYILSTVIWVYWGVCISDMVPFFAGRQAAKSGTGNRICEKLGVSQEKFDKIKANVQRHGNLIGIG